MIFFIVSHKNGEILPSFCPLFAKKKKQKKKTYLLAGREETESKEIGGEREIEKRLEVRKREKGG